jgi:hypothetical protein
VEWFFRDISDDPSEKELTQQHQFNNDEAVLAEALVRETFQNSTDASAGGGHVRIRFAFQYDQDVSKSEHPSEIGVWLPLNLPAPCQIYRAHSQAGEAQGGRRPSTSLCL